MKPSKLACVIASALLLTLPASAQNPPAGADRPQKWERPEDGRGPSRELVREDVLQELARNPEMLRRLELSPEQIDALKSSRENARTQMESLRKGIAESHAKLSELMSQPDSSDADINAAFEKTLEAEIEMRRLMFGTRLQIRSILGPEKTQRLQRLARDMRPERSEEGRPMMRRDREGDAPPPWMRDGGERLPGRTPPPPPKP